jgi:hypothetical protein
MADFRRLLVAAAVESLYGERPKIHPTHGAIRPSAARPREANAARKTAERTHGELGGLRAPRARKKPRPAQGPATTYAAQQKTKRQE